MKPKPKNAPTEVWGQIWGLTGGIASGKSTVARILADAGIVVVDADQISRSLSSEGGAAFSPIRARFGTTDRARLREVIFNDPRARKDLEAILHPMIETESLARIRAAVALKAPGRAHAVYEATLLIETGRYKKLAGLIVVVSDREKRRQRLLQRDHLPPELADKILDAQLEDSERRRFATHVIENNGSLAELRHQVSTLLPAIFPAI